MFLSLTHTHIYIYILYMVSRLYICLHYMFHTCPASNFPCVYHTWSSPGRLEGVHGGGAEKGGETLDGLLVSCEG